MNPSDYYVCNGRWAPFACKGPPVYDYSSGRDIRHAFFLLLHLIGRSHIGLVDMERFLESTSGKIAKRWYIGSVWILLILLKLKFIVESTVNKGEN